MQNFDKHYDIDEMLFETVLWLAQQVDCNVSDFVEISSSPRVKTGRLGHFLGDCTSPYRSSRKDRM